MEIYNTLGQRIKTLAENQSVSGKIEYIWTGDDDSGNRVANGMYFCRVIIDRQQVATSRILLTE